MKGRNIKEKGRWLNLRVVRRRKVVKKVTQSMSILRLGELLPLETKEVANIQWEVKMAASLNWGERVQSKLRLNSELLE